MSRWGFILGFLLAWAVSIQAGIIEWTDTDWSEGNYTLADGIDPESSPGNLIARNFSQQMLFLAGPSSQRGIWGLASFQGDLYAGAGPYPMTDAGAEVWRYSTEENTWELIAELPEEGILVLKAHNGKLYIPGMDAMTYWDRGNLYVFDGQNWTVHQNIPQAAHVFDVAFLGNQLFVSTGQRDLTGGVWRSVDGGGSWERILTLPSVDGEVRRVYGLGVFDGKLYAQPDGKDPEGRVVLVWDGEEWDSIPLGQISDHQWMLFDWEEQFCLGGNGDFYVGDGEQFQYANLPFQGNRWCRAFSQHREPTETTQSTPALFAGGPLGRIYRSTDGLNWTFWTQVGDGQPEGEVEGMASHLGRLYVSTYRENGTGRVYVSSSVPYGTLISRVFDTGGQDISQVVLDWAAVLPAGTSVKFQVRAAKTAEALQGLPFCGPDGTPFTYFETPKTLIPDPLTDGYYFQYKVYMSTDDPKLSPLLKWVRFTFYSGEDAAGVGETEGPQVRLAVYPNPTRDRVHLRGLAWQRGEFRLYDLAGRLAYRQVLESRGEEEPVLDLGRLPQGVYFYQVLDASGRVMKAKGRIQVLR
jgi:hypothetical protein